MLSSILYILLEVILPLMLIVAAEGVFWTTLAPAITVTATLAIVKSPGGVPDGS